MASLAMLLQAAEYLERNANVIGSEHGYAMHACIRARKEDLRHRNNSPNRKRHRQTRKSKQYLTSSDLNRCSHNQSEKMRRDHLRSCMEQLRKAVPLTDSRYGNHSAKPSTQQLLTKACRLIQTLQDNFEKHMDEKNRLLQMQNQLQTHFDRLKNSNACSVKRSNSVSSDDSAYSYLSSSPSNSDSGDHIDVEICDIDDRSHVSIDSGCRLSPDRFLDEL